MNRWFFVGATLLALAASNPAAHAAEPIEYRTITMLDGSVHRGVVVASDADNMRIKTLTGEVSLPLGDVVRVDVISRDAYLAAEGRKVIFLGIDTPGGSSAKALQIEALTTAILMKGTWLVARPADLSEARRKQLAACPLPGCWVEAVRSEGLPSLYGQLERRDGQDRIVLRRFARNGEQSAEVSLVVGEPQAEQDRLSRSIAIVMGDAPAAPAHPVLAAARPDTRKDESETAAPVGGPKETSGAGSPVAAQTTPQKASSPGNAPPAVAAGAPAAGTASKSPSGATPAPTGKAGTAPTAAAAPSPTQTSPASQAGNAPARAPDETAITARATVPAAPRDAGGARARRLDWLPVPGASSLLYYHDLPTVAVSAGIVTVFTGAAVYLSGDMRRLGMSGGLSVPWTYDEHAGRDAALLTGVGVVSYVASTWIVNHVVRQVTHRRSVAHPAP